MWRLFCGGFGSFGNLSTSFRWNCLLFGHVFWSLRLADGMVFWLNHVENYALMLWLFEHFRIEEILFSFIDNDGVKLNGQSWERFSFLQKDISLRLRLILMLLTLWLMVIIRKYRILLSIVEYIFTIYCCNKYDFSIANWMQLTNISHLPTGR